MNCSGREGRGVEHRFHQEGKELDPEKLHIPASGVGKPGASCLVLGRESPVSLRVELTLPSLFFERFTGFLVC